MHIVRLVCGFAALAGWQTHCVRAAPALSVLHAFSGTDGSDPNCRLIQDANGVLYGTSEGGNGTVFSLAPPRPGRTAWALTTLWTFSGTDGAQPMGGVIMDGAGNLYGATEYGGARGYGAVFELLRGVGRTGWTEQTLWSFGANGDGQNPAAGLTALPGGVIAGTTYFGGAGFGTVFQLTPPANGKGAWTEQLIWNFPGGTAGAVPVSALSRAASGVLFGTSSQGGANGGGTVFSLTPPNGQGGWSGEALYSFPANDLGNSAAEVAIDAAGTLYGTTILGGRHRGGTVFRLAPPVPGGIAWTYGTIANLPSRTELMGGGVALTAAGALVGAGGGLGNGEVFQLTPPAPGARHWSLNTLARFNGRNGESPFATPMVGVDGTIFGTTEGGGSGGAGVVWAVTGTP